MTDEQGSEQQQGTVALACPYCGATVTINLEWVGSGHMAYEAPESIECYASDCEASWEPNGVPRDAPKWEKWPELYDMPWRAQDRIERPTVKRTEPGK